MKTKTIISTLLIATIGLFVLLSFTSKDNDTNTLTSYDQSFYQDIDSNNAQFLFTEDGKCGDGKCGDDKKAKDADKATDAKEANEEKVEDAKEAVEKKAADAKEDVKEGEKKAEEGKDSKCGTGKCG